MESRCNNCPEYLCSIENRVICYLENMFLEVADKQFRRRIIRAVYAFSAEVEKQIFLDEFMSLEDEAELAEIKEYISAKYREEMMDDE